MINLIGNFHGKCIISHLIINFNSVRVAHLVVTILSVDGVLCEWLCGCFESKRRIHPRRCLLICLIIYCIKFVTVVFLKWPTRGNHRMVVVVGGGWSAEQ